MGDDHDKKLRVRARLVNGVLELESGGQAPITDGASIDLTIAARDISDPLFRQLMQAKSTIEVLPEGTKLLAAFSARAGRQQEVYFPDGSRAYPSTVSRIHHILERDWIQEAPYLVGMTIGPPIDYRAGIQFAEPGGLRLKIQGNRVEGIEVSSLKIPKGYAKEEAKSLNHALTMISEVVEHWRLSHTLNAYRRVFYQESNGEWCPLEWLRDDTLHRAEHTIALEMWRKFHAQFKPKA